MATPANLLKRYTKIDELVKEVREDIRPNQQSDVEVSATQEIQWMKCAELLLKYTSDEQLARAHAIIQEWALVDRQQTNPVEDSYFPCIIRSNTEKEFPLLQRPAIATAHGVERLLQANMSDSTLGIVPDESKVGFLTNYVTNGSNGRPRIERGSDRTVIINGVELSTWTKGEKSSRFGVSVSESWFTGPSARWNEAYRHMPFPLASEYLTWLRLIDARGFSVSEAERHGIIPLSVGILYMCYEWLARTGKTTLKKSGDVNPRSALQGWQQGKAVAIPVWMATWRKPMSYAYVTAKDVDITHAADIGLAEWSRTAQLARTRGLEIDEATFLKSRIPFIEQESGPPYITDSALTTICQLRVFTCFTAATETTGSSHLKGMSEFYLNVCHFLGAKPGRVGKKLTKLVSPVARMLAATPRRVFAPMTTLPSSGVFEPQCGWHDFEDVYTLQLMAEAFKCNASWSSLEEKVFDVPILGESLRAVYNEYKSTPVEANNTAVLDVMVHLTNPGHGEGYTRSCAGTLQVDGYMSKMKRVAMEGIDSDAEQPVSVYESAHWEGILQLLDIPSRERAINELRLLSNSKSGGADRCRMKVKRQVALGGIDKADEADFVMSSNRKNVTIALAAHTLLTPEIMKHQSSDSVPLPTGIRSVPARILRIIYNIPLPMQSLLHPLYVAMKTYMKANRRYILANRTGTKGSDILEEVNDSISLLNNAQMVSIADDASKLDQHEGTRGRNVAINAIRNHNALDSDYASWTGLTYMELLAHMLEGWNNNFFEMAIDSDQTAVMAVDTDPSGALITAEKNTVTSAAIQDMIVAKMKIPQKDSLWGDDAYATLSVPADRNIVDIVREREAIALEAGQIFDTLEGSWTGRGVHFLQVYTIWGQRIQRRMAIDHENHMRINIGDIGSLIDKYTTLAARGGNVELANMLILSTVIQGSRGKVFGRQSFATFPTMAAPGGFVNRILLGFPNPNSRLWLSLNWPNMYVGDEPITARPVIDRPEHVGRRLLSDDDTSVKITIGGVSGESNVGDLLKGARAALLETKRMESYRTVDKSKLAGNNVDKIGYSRWVRGAAEVAVGSTTIDKHLNKWFYEKSMVDAGYIARSRGVAPDGADVVEPTPDTGVKVDKYTIAFTFDSKFRIEVGHNEFTFVGPGVTRGLRMPYRWHPAWSQPLQLSLILSLCGMQASRSQITIRDLTAKFSPNKFRSDIHAEDVIGALKRVPASHHVTLLKYIGFSSEEVKGIVPHINKIGLYNDLAEVDEYAGLEDHLKSVAVDRLINMITLMNSEVDALMQEDANYRTVILSQFTSLLADEFNVAVSSVAPGGKLVVRVPMPRVSLS